MGLLDFIGDFLSGGDGGDDGPDTETAEEQEDDGGADANSGDDD